MNFEVIYESWMLLLLLAAILSGVLTVYNRKLMAALVIPAVLAVGTMFLLDRYVTRLPLVFVSGVMAFVVLSIWTISRSLAWGVAQKQRYVKVESRYLVVDEELFPDTPDQTDEHEGQHEVQGHWRLSASGTRHWVRAHTRSNPKGHSRAEAGESMKEEVEISWEPDGPPVNAFVLGWRWFWQAFPEGEYIPVRNDTDFDFVLPIRGRHAIGHKIMSIRQLECPACQQELLKWTCSCGTVSVFHERDGKWYPHPIDHLNQPDQSHT